MASTMSYAPPQSLSFFHFIDQLHNTLLYLRTCTTKQNVFTLSWFYRPDPKFISRVSHFMLERESKCLSTLILPPIVAEGIPFGDTHNRTHYTHA